MSASPSCLVSVAWSCWGLRPALEDKRFLLFMLTFSQASDSFFKLYSEVLPEGWVKSLRGHIRIKGPKELMHSKASLVFINNHQKQLLPYPRNRIIFSRPVSPAHCSTNAFSFRIILDNEEQYWFFHFAKSFCQVLKQAVKESGLNSQNKSLSVSLHPLILLSQGS